MKHVEQNNIFRLYKTNFHAQQDKAKSFFRKTCFQNKKKFLETLKVILDFPAIANFLLQTKRQTSKQAEQIVRETE